MFFCNHVKPENVSLLRGAKLHFAQVEFTNWAELKFASKRILFLCFLSPTSRVALPAGDGLGAVTVSREKMPSPRGEVTCLRSHERWCHSPYLEP